MADLNANISIVTLMVCTFQLKVKITQLDEEKQDPIMYFLKETNFKYKDIVGLKGWGKYIIQILIKRKLIWLY